MALDTNKYSGSVRLMHWLVGAIFIGMIFLGFNIDHSNLLRDIHKTIGISFIVAVTLRIFLRLKSTDPQPIDGVSSIMLKLSSLVHLMLYVVMVLVPVSGLTMSIASGKDINLFIYKLHTLSVPNKAVASLLYSVHEITVRVAIVIIVLHVLATLKHLLVDKRNILKRML